MRTLSEASAEQARIEGIAEGKAGARQCKARLSFGMAFLVRETQLPAELLAARALRFRPCFP